MLDLASERAALQQEVDLSQRQLAVWSQRHQHALGALAFLERLETRQGTEAAAADAGTAPSVPAKKGKHP